MLRLFKFLRPYAIPLAAILALVAVQSIADLCLPTMMSDIVDKGVTNGDMDLILRKGLEMLLFTLCGALCAAGSSYLSAHAAMGAAGLVREEVFERVTSFSLEELDKFGTPSLVTRTINDVSQVQSALVMMLRTVVGAPITMIGGVILALSKDKGLGWVIVAIIPPLAAVIAIVSTKGFPLFRAIQERLDDVNRVLRENLSGLRVVRAFNRVGYEKRRLDKANANLMEASLKVGRTFAVLVPVLLFIMNVSTVLVLWFGSVRVDRGTSNVGNMMAFLQYAMLILESLLMASFVVMMLPRALASAIRINEVLDASPTIGDPEEPAAAKERKGFIEFDRVSFSYRGAEVPALSDISFTAGPGEVTAIIGSTGSGKSTLINLIPRFYDVDSGTIRIDGVDIRDLSQDGLRSRIGLVPQKTVLFSGSVADNIRFGNEDADDAQIEDAARAAQAIDFIEAMDGGFDSRIAQGGRNVSGGQKQRLAIARALVRKPEIYLFDDSFSALDFKTDAALRAALKERISDATLLIVGQRVASIMDADRIIVLDEGRIAGVGRHEELYRSCDVYREIVVSQLSSEELA